MAKQSGLGDHLIIDGQDISGDVNSLSNIHGGPAPWDVTGIDKSANERTGLERDGGLGFVAFHNAVPLGTHVKLSALPTADRLVTYLRGVGVGSDAANCIGKQINYDPTRGADGSLTFAVDVQADGFGLEWGLQYTAGLRTDTVATNGVSIDSGAATAFGMQAYLHVASVVGTSVTVKLQDSADNTTFADITGLTFGAVAPGGAPASFRLQTANTVTIRRYVRAVTTGTFTSAVFQLTATRNEVAGVAF
jgi:hypothetical protein